VLSTGSVSVFLCVMTDIMTLHVYPDQGLALLSSAEELSSVMGLAL
jgi:hypothetical protein